MPPGTPFPGFWENSRTPYSIEIMDNMSPLSPVMYESVMKGVQLGLTAQAENVIGYWMDESPTAILYVTATDDLLEKWSSTRLEPLIDSIGMRKKIYFQADMDVKSRRTGDKVFRKEYSGGALRMASAQSPAGLRSDSIRVLVLDEIDGAPKMLRTGEGVWLDVAYARTDAWGARKKIMEYSTPTTFEESLIYQQYLSGDQRKFNVPCPRCGVHDFLDFKNLRHEMFEGHLEKVWYECPHCFSKIYNHEKSWMMGQGHWEPTAIPRDPFRRSYHLPSIYSPVGMLSWHDLYSRYLKAQSSPDGMRSFVNLYLGMPYKQAGYRPKLEQVCELRGEYSEGEIPDGVLFLTAGIDVQAGSVNDPLNPPRLEMEILGIGASYRTWSIGYLVFEGNTTGSSFEGAWEKIHTWALGGGLTFRRSDGVQFQVSLIFIDSGDGNYVDVVYGFTSRWNNTYASKGFSALKKRKEEKGDEAGPHNFLRYRMAKSVRQSDCIFYEISTNYYKTQIYRNLSLERRPLDPQRPGFCNFPRDRSENYFKMLTAEKKRLDGSFDAGGRRNEALDCFDEETEILTDKGWCFIKDLNKTELVATVNLEKDSIEYQNPIEYIERYHYGKMVHIKGVRLDILVTPKHRMIASKKKQEVICHSPYRRKWNLNTPFEFVLAEDLTIHHQLKNSSNWKRPICKVLIPKFISNQGVKIADAKKIDAKVWAAFLGFYIAEGCKRREFHKKRRSWAHRVQLDQNEGPKAEKLRVLLAKLPWNFREEQSPGSRRWVCTQKQLYMALEGCGEGVKNKKVPGWVKEQDASIISEFLDWAIMGDGHVDKKGHRSYYTISRILADDIQELFIKSGSNARIDFHEEKPYKRFREGLYNGGENTKPQYHVRESRFSKKSIDGGGNGKRECLAKKIEWEGMVYCVSVPNETLILRRKGISFMAGNCRTYALCAGDVYLDARVQALRVAAKERGATAMEIAQINHKLVLDVLEKQTARRKFS